ncbi:nucleoside 2-deoxyribosyltransferase [Pseudomonas syringae pv. syringae]|uniref:PfkB family carbohydrate kinase n=1 Tax=Pseudomonas syringae TaxID=317 RepID=UPI0007EE90A2|nr:PfkB family carbohydrate kinase [Pseudomonas syringae]NAO53691.1 nucleoside 2-deoxyribosyltransferase [Pseudomonas syringae]OBS37006.1 nucleoside 2-deoxyribosyltransferase [Pseudomonas syringae pv. syringae]
MITIVGGIYGEHCVRPAWDEVYGSAGRAATAIARFGGDVELQGFVDADQQYIMENRAALERFKFQPHVIATGLSFEYLHGLSRPAVIGALEQVEELKVAAPKVLRFGMIEATVVVDAEYAVYDPQSADAPQSFGANGSKASHLALVLNRNEAGLFIGDHSLSPESLAKAVADKQHAEVVIIKMGPLGALVYDKGNISRVSAHRTARVWKIGSGDTFAAHFALAWMEEGLSAHNAAVRASKATAYYCDTQGHPSARLLAGYAAVPLEPSERYRNGFRPKVYLAGPFFTLAQLWMVTEARNALTDLGLRVFSPYHDVGLGSADDVVQKDLQAIHDCDLVFAIGDGLDSGTIYEIGYARALDKPVVVYVENESAQDRKMMEGSHCRISDDYVSAIYQVIWEACTL